MNLYRVFNSNSKFSCLMSKIFDIIALNLIFLVMSIPIITIGANITAVYSVSLKIVNDSEGEILSNYIKSFKDNFKQATILWIIMLALGFILICDINLAKNINAPLILQYIFHFMTLIYFFVFIYMFPYQSKFYNTKKNTVINSLILSIKFIPYTIIMFGIIVVPSFICINSTEKVFAFYILYLYIIGFSGTAYINSIFFNKIFKKCMSQSNKLSTI